MLGWGGGRWGEGQCWGGVGGGAVCAGSWRVWSRAEQSEDCAPHPPAQGGVCGVRMRPPDVSLEEGGALGGDPRGLRTRNLPARPRPPSGFTFLSFASSPSHDARFEVRGTLLGVSSPALPPPMSRTGRDLWRLQSSPGRQLGPGSPHPPLREPSAPGPWQDGAAVGSPHLGPGGARTPGTPGAPGGAGRPVSQGHPRVGAPSRYPRRGRPAARPAGPGAAPPGKTGRAGAARAHSGGGGGRLPRLKGAAALAAATRTHRRASWRGRRRDGWARGARRPRAGGGLGPAAALPRHVVARDRAPGRRGSCLQSAADEDRALGPVVLNSSTVL